MMKVAKTLLIVFVILGLVQIGVGAVVALTVDPTAEEAVLKYIYPPLGMAMALAGVLIYAFSLRAQRRREYLYGYGRCVQAQVVAAEQNFNVKVNRQHPWVVKATCVHPLTGETVTVKSHSVWAGVPAVGDKVPVWFDPMNEKRYAFELQEDQA